MLVPVHVLLCARLEFEPTCVHYVVYVYITVHIIASTVRGAMHGLCSIVDAAMLP